MNDKEIFRELTSEIRSAFLQVMRERPTINKEHNIGQGYRTLLTLFVGGCLNEGLSPDTILEAVSSSIEGWQESKAEDTKGAN